ncbi:hypothetical protein FRB99_000402 [Tulasnella sp. 403]|nr:hypothetical protein FRB99_000402 [Tulasnella sp. 403]
MPPKRKGEAVGFYDFDKPLQPNTKRVKPMRGLNVEGGSKGHGEKRLARMRSSCPKNIEERVERVMIQRFFLIDRHRNGDELREEYKVLGSTGNVYTVVIGVLPSCNCPDAQKGNHCKHILFVFLKVLGVSRFSHVYYQKALLQSELEQIFASARVPSAHIAPPQFKEVFDDVTGASSSKGKEKAQANKPKKQLTDEDECAVCFEGLKGVPASDLAWCAQCSKALHQECLGQWQRTKGDAANCPYCRAPWAQPQPGASGSSSCGALSRAVISEGYLNLGDAFGISRIIVGGAMMIMMNTMSGTSFLRERLPARKICPFSPFAFAY